VLRLLLDLRINLVDIPKESKLTYII